MSLDSWKRLQRSIANVRRTFGSIHSRRNRISIPYSYNYRTLPNTFKPIQLNLLWSLLYFIPFDKYSTAFEGVTKHLQCWPVVTLAPQHGAKTVTRQWRQGLMTERLLPRYLQRWHFWGKRTQLKTIPARTNASSTKTMSEQSQLSRVLQCTAVQSACNVLYLPLYCRAYGY